MNRRAIVGALALGLGWPAAVSAAPPRVNRRGSTDGVERTYHDYSGEGDASSLELNPALLSGIKGFDLTFRGFGATSDYVRGSGFGGFVAFNLGLGFALGLGAQYVTPGLDEDVFDEHAAWHPRMTKLSLGLSTGMGEYGSFGVGVHGVRAGGDWLQQPDVDLGLMTRLLNYGSVGVVGRLSPAGLRSDVLPARVSLIGELALRPLGTHTIELAGGARMDLLEALPGASLERVGRTGILPRARVSLRWHGLALRGEIEQVRASTLDPQTLAVLGEEKAWRGSVGLEASWDFVTVGGGVGAGVSEGVDGFDVYARVHSRRRGRVVPVHPVAIDRLVLQDVVDDRDAIELLQRIERATKAGRRASVLVDARGVGLGWATAHEIREALVRLRNAGGHVFAYLEAAGLADYYLASVAEKVFVHPAGSFETYGIASTNFYFADALAKIGVKAEIIRIGAYKSAGETWSASGPSAEDRRQREAYLEDIYERVVYDIARARGLDKAKVRAAFDDAPHGPDRAVELGLADEVVFRDALADEISEVLGTDVSFGTVPDIRPQDPTWSRAPYIGVVLIDGTIIDGESRYIPFLDITFTGGDTIAETLRDLRADPACQGIVLRVNSPGGSALASDVIWREVERTTKAFADDPRGNPPIAVSMSDVAASGGYYIAMGTPQVFADPNTITGSIGVISINFDLSGLLQKLGISTATFKQGENPDINSFFEPYTADQRAKVEASIQRTYDLFRKRVAAGRGLTMERVDELGRGRVYSGTDAQAVDLVDELGGLHEAMAWVRKTSEVPDFRELEVVVVPEKVRLLDLILQQVGNPFADAGPIRKAVAKRQAAARAEAMREVLPLALDRALSRLPLSLLFLREGASHTIMPFVPGRD